MSYSIKKNNWLYKEDSWAIIIALLLISAITLLWLTNQNHIYQVINIKFKGWSEFSNFSLPNIMQLLTLFIIFGLSFFIVAFIRGLRAFSFIFGFIILFILSVVTLSFAASDFAKTYQLESPLVALLLGLIISNFTKLPKWFEESLLTEFYVKIGIVLMGATMPLTVLINAGAVAILQACIITTITFFSIYFVATRIFKLDNSFGATLGAGGSICGVSASIVIGNACGAKQEHISISISIVVFWAVIMVIVLPFLCRLLNLDSAVAGAWIGTSEFADAAGLAAAQSIDDRAIEAFTLIKVIGRDMFVGVWAVLVSFLSIAIWSKNSDSQKVNIGLIWERFPKFILGFIGASIVISLFMLNLDSISSENYQKDALSVIKSLRNWVFTWTFLSIGLSTNFRKLQVGYKPFLAFSIGVAINLPLGFILSNYIFVDFWLNFMK